MNGGGAGRIGRIVSPTLPAYNHPVTLNFPDLSDLCKSIEDNLKEHERTISEDGEASVYDSSDWDRLIDQWKNGVTIIPECVADLMGQNSRVPYPAIGDFGISGAYEEVSNTVLRSKFNNLAMMKKTVEHGPDDLTKIVYTMPMHETKRKIDCGMIRATGEYKITANYDGKGNGYGLKAQYQKRSCHCATCETCGEKAILDDAWLYSQDIWARVLGLNMIGAEPHVYEWVFSPPQATREQYRETVKAMRYKEGQEEYERTISFIVRSVCGDKDARFTGWTTFYHPERQNGRDGQHRPWDGNDGNPYHHRISPHYHVIVVSTLKGPALIRRLNDLTEAHPFLKDWLVIIGPNKEDKKRARKLGIRYTPHEIKDRHELEHKLAYILSHTGVKQKTDRDGELIGRRLPMISLHGLNHYRRMKRLTLKGSVPLLSQGYEETVREDGQDLPLYWANYFYECVARDKNPYYAHVERINSAHVYVFNFDSDGARRDIAELVRMYRDNPSNADHPEGLLSSIYHYIRADSRFIFDFSPMEGHELRYPYRLYMKAGERDLWNLITSDDSRPDLYGRLPELPDLSGEGSDNPRVAEGIKGPPTGGASPSGNVARSDDAEDWRDGLDDYALRFAGGWSRC